jgi:WD40 repeat protein
VSADGKLLAASYSGQAGTRSGFFVWDVRSGELVKDMAVNLGSTYYRGIAFSPDSRLIGFGSEALGVYDTGSLEQRSFMRTDSIKAVAFSPDKQFVAIVYIRGDVVLRSATTNQQIASLTHPRTGPGGETLAFSSNGKVLASSKHDSIRIWNLSGTGERTVLAGHEGGVPCIAYSPDQKLIASGGKDRVVRVWRRSDGQEIGALSSLGGPLQSLAFSPDGKLLATGDWSTDGTSLRLWRMDTLAEVTRVAHQLGPVCGIGFSPDGQYLAACGDGMAVWSLQGSLDGLDGAQISTEPLVYLPGKSCLYLAFSPKESMLAWVENWQTVRAWDVRDNRELPLPNARASQGWHGLAFLPDGKQIAFIGENGAAEVWDITQGERRKTIGTPSSFKSPHIAVSRDGRLLAGNIEPQVVAIWDIARNKQLFAFRAERSQVWALAWSPDSDQLAVGLADGGLALWNLERIYGELEKIQLAWER